ncbi:MAG: short-chain dehydrogenase/reductase [Microbacteriaceae bacterium]|nr:short-chain dehydrogenase/reductase [Microbacteriaceae bacterium]
MTDRFSLAGRVALVTGASGGLGERMAFVLAEAGAEVIVVARRFDKLQALVETLPGTGHLAIRCDLENPTEIETMVSTAIAERGAVTVLVNNAGFHKPTPVDDESLEQYDQTLALNLRAPYVLSKAIAPHMAAAGGGSIVNIASVAAFVGNAKVPSAPYAASKGGLVAMTRDLAAQWASQGIRVNALCPGWFTTDITAPMLESEGGRTFVARQMPFKRPGRIEEIDGPLLFLASDASSYVTGVALPVDGGLVAT